MKIVGVREAQKNLGGLISQSQKEPVVFTRHGRPAAVLRGVGGRKAENVYREESQKFWDEIEEARNDPRPNLTQEEIEQKYGVKKKARGTSRTTRP